MLSLKFVTHTNRIECDLITSKAASSARKRCEHGTRFAELFDTFEEDRGLFHTFGSNLFTAAEMLSKASSLPHKPCATHTKSGAESEAVQAARARVRPG